MGLIAALICGSLAIAKAQEAGTPASEADAGKTASGMPTVTFQMVRPGVPVPRFRIAVREDGTGTYSGVDAPAAVQAGSDGAPAAVHTEQEITLSAKTTAKIFKTARTQRYFNTTCASKAKNIADTGAKVLSYAGTDGSGSCTYNFSEIKDVSALTDLFLGVATTLDEGRRLEFQHRYDHLGLDAELDVLTQANDGGRAIELGVIAPQLRALAGDPELMERVRLRANKLLGRAAEGK